MRFVFFASLALAALAVGLAFAEPHDPNIASTDPLSPADEAKAFHLPDGFEIQLVASEPDIHKPLNMAFDDRGRLWVTDTVEYPFAAKENPRDSAKILENFARDGRARKITTFAGGLNIPIGLLPLPATNPQQALVFSIPDIWRIREGGNREIVYQEYGHRDTHGMTSSFTPGFDGWIYACHGFANDSTIRAGDGSSVTMNSGNTYRFKADGSRVEAFTHGQVNPFGLCFDPSGNLYSADCHSQPIYQLLRGGYYPSFGKPHDGLGYAPEMFRGYADSTAIAGIVYYAADNFPPSYRNCAYIGDVVTNRLVRFKIAWHGSTPKAAMDYFLKSDDPWFRPVAIQLGPDGALYVADFYNRIIGHYEVPLDHPGRDRERGRIWRIVYKGPDAAGTPAPRADWSRANVNDLVHDLGHPNLSVRMLATNELVGRGGENVVKAALAEFERAGNSALSRVHALWVLERCRKPSTSALVAAAGDASALVRIHAQRVLASRQHWSAEEHALAVAGLKDSDATVRRAAADALGRHPAAENIRPLLDLRQTVDSGDTHLLHVVRMALRDQFQPIKDYSLLPRADWTKADTQAIADVSFGVPTAAAAAFLLQFLERHEANRTTLVNSCHHIARYGDATARDALLKLARAERPEDRMHQAALLRAIARGTQERGGTLSPDVLEHADQVVTQLVHARAAKEIREGVELAGSLQLEGQQQRLAALAVDNAAAREVRSAALTALANLDVCNHARSLGPVLADSASPIELREQAASLLARDNRPETLAELMHALPDAPARLQNGIAAGLAGRKIGAEQLLEAVATGKASARLLQERSVAVKLRALNLPRLDERLAKLTADLRPADDRLNQLLKNRRDGFRKAKTNPALGKQVFDKSCATCHQLNGQGAKIGPQLDGIGIRGLDRLLEDTLDPNRNVDQAFRLTTLLLKKGQVVSGLVLREEGAVLVLADSQGKEMRVEKDAVEERTTSQQSPMPANFAEQIPEAEFYDLLAFLLQQRVAPSPAK